MMANVVAKGMNGRPKTVERATNTALLLCELEASDVVVDALLKGTTNKVPKLALAATDAIRAVVCEFGTPKVVNPKPILKGIAPLFDSKDAKIRGAAKDLTVELTRWLGQGAVRRDLIDKMRGTMQAEVSAMIEQQSEDATGAARPTRFTRKEQASGASSDPMDVDDDATAGGDGAEEDAAVVPDSYEYSDPETILDKLEKAPENKEQPRFWEAIVSAKWKERLGALTQLREVSDVPRIAAGDYGNLARALKKVITKDANIACVGEAAAAAGVIARGARREFRSEAKLLLPGMLDKLKDKNTTVIQKIQDALMEFANHCVSLADVADDVVVALGHKVPKVAEQTLRFVAAAVRECKGGRAAITPLHKAMLPSIVKCADAGNVDVRTTAVEAIAAIAVASGGFRQVAKHVDTLDDAKKTKVEELCSGGGGGCGEGTLRGRDPNVGSTKTVAAASKPPNVVRSSVTGALIRPGTAGPFRPGKSALKRPSTAAPGVSSKPSSSKPSNSAGFSSEADAEVTEGPAASKEELVERMTTLYGAGTVDELQSGDWKKRLSGMTAVLDAVNAMSPSDATSASETTVRGVAMFPGFDDKNFQVLSKVFEVFNALATNSETCTKRDGAQAIAGLAEKIADVKLRKPASDALTALAEALGPKFVMAQLHKRTAGHKNPKVTAEALSWCVAVVNEFSASVVDVAFTIKWCKECLGMPNPLCKSSAGKVLGALHGFLGPGLTNFLADLKDAQLKSLEAEFARNPFTGEVPAVKVTRKVKGAPEGGGDAVDLTSDGGLPRTDISSKITEKLVKQMSDPSWKVRAAAVEAVGGILTEANKRIGPNTGELMPAIAKRFGDSNRNIATNALKLCGDVAEAMGPSVGERRYGHGLVNDITKQFGDSKSSVRTAAAGALDSWASAAGLNKTLPYVATTMLDASGKMSGDGKSDALVWSLNALAADAGNDVDLSSVVVLASVGLGDKATAARTAGGKLLDEVIRRVGSKETSALCKLSDAPGSLKKAVVAHVEKGGIVVGSSAPSSLNPSLNPSPSVSPIKSAPTRPTTARGGAVRASKGAAGAAPPAAVASASGAALAPNEEKESRIKKLPKKPVKFEVLRDEQLAFAEGELKVAMAPYVREDVRALLFKADFKAHIKALEHLDGALAEAPENVFGNLDLILRWIVLRVSEQAPNTQSLLRVLDFTAAVLGVVKAQGSRLSEQEAALFLPALVDKCGHSMDAVRGKFRIILRLIPGLFPASRLVGYLVRGLDSKNTKTRLEVLDVIESLLERHGVDVVERGGNKALAEVAKLADARDMSMRTAALKCLVTAYKTSGAVVWKHVGRLGDLAQQSLEDKFARAEKEMAAKNEGKPGAWMKDGVLAGGSTAATPGTGVKKTASRSNGTPGRPSTPRSPIAAIASTLMRPVHAAAGVVSAVLPGRRTPKREAPPSPSRDDVETLPMEVRLAGWKRSLNSVASVSDAVAVEGMKSLCHEIMGAVSDQEMLQAMAPDVDGLVGVVAERVSTIFESAAVAPGPSTTRACKYVLNTLMQVYQEPALAGAVGEASEKVTIAALLERLLDQSVGKMDEGSQLVKALNVLMLKVLEHCPRTSSFRALIQLLARAPESVAEDESALTKFNDLVVKCLIKLTKALAATLRSVDVSALLLEVHDFFDSLGVDEIRRRGQADDKPLRMVKTILHEVTKLLGHDVHDCLDSCPPRSTEPVPIIYAYIDLNLQSMPNAPGIPREPEPEPKPVDAEDEAEPEPEPEAVEAEDEAEPEPEPEAVEAEHPETPAPPSPPPAKSATPKVRTIEPATEPATPAADEATVTTPPKESPAPAKTSPPEATTAQPTTPGGSAVKRTTTRPSTPGTGARTPVGDGDVEMMDVDIRPATPVSADLKTTLAGIFKKIGEKESTAKGLEELFDFCNAHAEVDISPHLARTSAAFQTYIKRGLAKVEAARARAASATTPGASTIEPSPMPTMEKSATEVYRERLARMQSAAKSSTAAATSAGATGTSGAGLSTLRERMNRIAAKAAGDVSSPRSGGSTANAQFENDIKARMSRIQAEAVRRSSTD